MMGPRCQTESRLDMASLEAFKFTDILRSEGNSCSAEGQGRGHNKQMCISKEMCAETRHCNFVAEQSVYTLGPTTNMVLLYGGLVCALQAKIWVFKLFWKNDKQISRAR